MAEEMSFDIAIELLIELARNEIKRTELATKMIAQYGAVAPYSVRKSARRRERLIEAVKVVQAIQKVDDDGQSRFEVESVV